MDFQSTARDFFADTANRWMAAVFLVASYLVLFNLGHSPLWHDEGTSGLMAKIFLKTFNMDGWDGERTLYLGPNGRALNSDLRITYTPWTALPSALGIVLFGINDFAVRFFHSLLGLASLLIFWVLLCRDFANQPRLRVLAFTLFALSTQVILFMRLGRYIADSYLFTLLAFYAYRLYIAPGGKTRHLVFAALATLLNFFNHFAIGASFALALGSWHCIYHWRQTTTRQWREFIIAGVIVAALCFWYLLWIKRILSDERLEYTGTFYQMPLLERKLTLVFENFRDMIHLGLLPMWVAIWFVWYVGFGVYQRLKPADDEEEGEKNKKSKKAAKPAADLDDERTQIIRWVVLGALFVVFSGLLSVRSPVVHDIADSRYIAPVLFFTALISAAFVDWLWRSQMAGKPIALVSLMVLLTTNVFSLPYAFPNVFTQKRIYLLLPNLVAEIHHRPYQNYMSDALFYLRTHTRQDETIYVHPHQEFTVLQFYLSDKLIFCCSLDGNSPLPRHKLRELGMPFYERDIRPDWIAIGAHQVLDLPDYDLVYTSQFYAYPTNRPELEFHTFKPLSTEDIAKIVGRGRPQRLADPGLAMRIYRKR